MKRDFSMIWHVLAVTILLLSIAACRDRFIVGPSEDAPASVECIYVPGYDWPEDYLRCYKRT